MKHLIKKLLIEGLEEARSIEGNISKEENLGELLTHIYDNYGFNNVFVSFRDSQHVGKINPSNRFNTPTGLYTYNLINFINEPTSNLRAFRNIFPFASHRKYIQFLIIKDGLNLLDSNYDKSKLDGYVNQIQSKFGNIGPVNGLCERWLKGEYESYYSGAKHPTHRFWLFIFDAVPYIYPNGKKNNSFSIICRALGIDGFHDDKCEGWIHPSEECQTVFFKSNLFKDEFMLSSVQSKMKEPTKVSYTENQVIKMISQHKLNPIKDFDKLIPYLGNSKIKNYIKNYISNESDVRGLLEYSNEPEKVLDFLGNKGVELITKLNVSDLIEIIMYSHKPERLSVALLSNSKITDRLSNKAIASVISQSKTKTSENFVDILGNRLNEILLEISTEDFVRIFTPLDSEQNVPEGSNVKNQKLADRLINDKSLMSQLDLGKAALLIHVSNHSSGDMDSDLIKYGHKV